MKFFLVIVKSNFIVFRNIKKFIKSKLAETKLGRSMWPALSKMTTESERPLSLRRLTLLNCYSTKEITRVTPTIHIDPQLTDY